MTVGEANSIDRRTASRKTTTAPFSVAIDMPRMGHLQLPPTRRPRRLGNDERRPVRGVASAGGVARRGVPQLRFHALPDASGRPVAGPHGGGRRVDRRPFTKADNEAQGELWTPIVSVGAAVIEVAVLAGREEELKLTLISVNRGSRELSAVSSSVPP